MSLVIYFLLVWCYFSPIVFLILRLTHGRSRIDIPSYRESLLDGWGTVVMALICTIYHWNDRSMWDSSLWQFWDDMLGPFYYCRPDDNQSVHRFVLITIQFETVHWLGLMAHIPQWPKEGDFLNWDTSLNKGREQQLLWQIFHQMVLQIRLVIFLSTVEEAAALLHGCCLHTVPLPLGWMNDAGWKGRRGYK